MKLRVAKKVYKFIGTPDEDRYRQSTLSRSIRRIAKTPEHRELHRWWSAYRETVGGARLMFEMSMRELEDVA